jgi:hypothetical protein
MVVIITCAKYSFQPTEPISFPEAFGAALKKYDNPTAIQALWSAIESGFGDQPGSISTTQKTTRNQQEIFEQLLAIVQKDFFSMF